MIVIISVLFVTTSISFIKSVVKNIKIVSAVSMARIFLEQDHDARAGLPCVFGSECLQFNYDDATSYLQCDA